MHQGVITPNPGLAAPSSLGHNLLLLAFIFTSYPTFLSPFGALGPWWDLSWPMAAPAAPATVVLVTVSANEKEELEKNMTFQEVRQRRRIAGVWTQDKVPERTNRSSPRSASQS